MKTALMLIMIAALLLPAGQALAADTSKEITVNFVPMHFIIDGVEYTPPADQPGFLYVTDDNKAHTYVPLRFVANILYRSVGWDGAAIKVTVANPAPTIEADLAKQVVENSVIEPVDKSKLQRTKIVANKADITYIFDGNQVQPNSETPGFIYQGRTYVPLRFMYNSLGYDNDHIAFDGDTYTITATSTEDQLAYRGILKSYAAELEEIFLQAESELTGFAFENASKALKGTHEEKLALYEEGEVILGKWKVLLLDKIDEMSNELTEASLSADIAADYTSFYQEKEDAKRLQAKTLLGLTE